MVSFGRIGKQGDLQIVVFAELRQLFWLVGADADDSDVGVVKHFEVLGEVASFLGAARGVGAWVEVDNNALAGEVCKRNGFAFVAGQGECGGGVALFESNVVSHNSPFYTRLVGSSVNS